MTQVRHASTDYSTKTEPTGWVGWVVFAGIMLFMLGSFQAIEGLVAIFNDNYFVVSSGKLLVSANFATWGWLHLAIGVIAMFAGWGVLAGQTWARIFGIGVAFLGALANMAFINAYPIWSLLLIALDVVVIYALAVHGREVKVLE